MTIYNIPRTSKSRLLTQIALRHLAIEYGLSHAFASENASKDEPAESYVHELCHGLIEGTLSKQTSRDTWNWIARFVGPDRDECELRAAAVEITVHRHIDLYFDYDAFVRYTLSSLNTFSTLDAVETTLRSFSRERSTQLIADDVAALIRSRRE